MLYLLTAFSVSIDAYVAGLALSIGEKLDLKRAVYVFVFTFILSLISLFIGRIISRYGMFFKILGALLFVFLGIKNVCGSYGNKTEQNRASGAVVGIGVGTDAGVACLSFSVSSVGAVAVALAMAAFHGCFFILGQKTATFLKTAKRTMLASGVFLILLGIYKLF